MPTITTADKLLASVEISSTQLLDQVRQFNALVTALKPRRELALNLCDLTAALRENIHMLNET